MKKLLRKSGCKDIEIDSKDSRFVVYLQKGYIVVPYTDKSVGMELVGEHSLLAELKAIAKEFRERVSVGVTKNTIEKLVGVYNRIDFENRGAEFELGIISEVLGLKLSGSLEDKREEVYRELQALGDSLAYADEGEVERIEVVIRDVGADEIEYLERVSDFRYDESKHRVWGLGDKSESDKLYWHGTRSENVYNLIGRGIKIKPEGAACTGSMFGNHCYFADRYVKSRNYTSIRGRTKLLCYTNSAS